jgi:hypothetical protein
LGLLMSVREFFGKVRRWLSGLSGRPGAFARSRGIYVRCNIAMKRAVSMPRAILFRGIWPS